MNTFQIQLENDYFNQQMTCINIIQCVIEAHKLSGVYTCEECKEELSCESEVWTHVPTHFNLGQPVPIAHNIEMNGIGHELELDMELDMEPVPELEPVESESELEMEPEPEPYDEPMNVGERYECRICNRSYNTNLALNTHIYNDHNNYNDLLALDDKPISDAFPGIDILIHIRMIRYVELRIGMKKKIERCCLCYEQYNEFKRARCTSDLPNHPKTSSKKKVFRCDQMIGTHSKYNDELKKIVPIEMQCCRADMCVECMKSHINAKQELVCPFCNRNHTQYNKRFIIFDERPYEKIKNNPDPYPLYAITNSTGETKHHTDPYFDLELNENELAYQQVFYQHTVVQHTVDQHTFVQHTVDQPTMNGSVYSQFANEFKRINNMMSAENAEELFEYYQLSLIQMMDEKENKPRDPVYIPAIGMMAERVD